MANDIAPIVIEILAKGMPQVSQSIRSIADVAARAEKQRVSDAERGARDRQRAVDREARDAVRTAERSAAYMARVRERSATMAGQFAARQANAERREFERAERDKVRIARQSAEEIASVRRRIAGAVVGAGAKGVAAGAKRVGGVAAGLANTAVQLGGGFSIADAVGQRASLDRAAAQLANSAIGVNGVTAADADPAKIAARARAASIATGTDATELASAAQSYVAKSSDFKGAMDNMEFFGKVAKATGTSLADVANAAGIIRSQNKDLGTNEMKDMILAVIKQGQQGSVEFSDLASSAGKITRSATSFAGSQTENQQKLLGLSQIAVRTAGSPESAAIALSSLASDTRGNRARIGAALGGDVLDAGGKINRSPEQLIADIMGATGGNLAALGQKGGLGFTKPTMKIFEALKPDFDKAYAEWLKGHKGDTKGASAAGARAAMAEMTGVTGSTMKMEDLDPMFKRVQSSSAEQFDAAVRQLRTAVGDALLPAFLQLADELRKDGPVFASLLRDAVPPFVELIRALAQFAAAHKDLIANMAAHPIGTLVGLEVSKSFASAGLPTLLQSLMKASFGQGGGVPSVGGAGGASASGAGGLITAGAVAQVAGLYGVYSDTSKAIRHGRELGATADEATVESARAKSGGLATAGAWSERLGKGLSYLTSPGTALLGSLAESGMESAGMKSASASSLETLKASALVDSAELQRVTTQAIANGVREGVQQGNSGPGGAGRKDSILDR